MESSEKKIYIKKCPICEKQIKWEHGSKPNECPYCGAIRWDKPIDEAILFNIQKKYLETKDKKYIGQMYNKLVPYARKIAAKMLNGNYSKDIDSFEDKVEDSVTYFISYFLKRDNYYITESFGFQLLKALQQQFYRKKQQDVDKLELSYDAPISGDGEKTFKDKLSEDLEDGNFYSNRFINTSNKIFLLKELSDFIDSLFDAMVKNRGVDSAILSLLLLHHYLNKKKEDFFNEFYNYFGSDLKETFELTKIALMEYIEDLNKDSI